MRVDMHIHSIYSPDGVVDVKTILKIAKKIKLDAVAITDHNEIKGALEARKLGIVPVIVGIEISTAEGHVLGYNVDCKIPRGLDVNETIEKIHECGGFAVAAHPYRFWSGIGEKAVLKNAKFFDAVEIFNGRCKRGSNRRAKKLAERLGLGFTAGSDAHNPHEIGRAGLIVECGVEDIWECVRKGEVEIFGRSRNFVDTVGYVKKAVGEWIRRGFKRI